jgi:hypothetical protein
VLRWADFARRTRSACSPHRLTITDPTINANGSFQLRYHLSAGFATPAIRGLVTGADLALALSGIAAINGVIGRQQFTLELLDDVVLAPQRVSTT